MSLTSGMSSSIPLVSSLRVSHALSRCTRSCRQPRNEGHRRSGVTQLGSLLDRPPSHTPHLHPHALPPKHQLHPWHLHHRSQELTRQEPQRHAHPLPLRLQLPPSHLDAAGGLPPPQEALLKPSLQELDIHREALSGVPRQRHLPGQ